MPALQISQEDKNITISYQQPVRPYHTMVAELAVDLTKDNQKDLLDLGCGTGNTLVELEKLSSKFNVAITDVDQKCLDLTCKRVDVKHNLLMTSIDDIINDGKKYDVILISHVLHYDPNPTYTMKELLKLLNEDGMIIIAVANAMNLNKIFNNLRRKQFSQGVFTWDRSTFNNFIENLVGGKIVKWKFDYVPLPLVRSYRVFDSFGKFLARIFPWLSFSVIAVIKNPQ